MINLTKTVSAAMILAVIMMLVSCTPESCLEETDANIKAPFYLNTAKAVKAPDSLTVYGLNTGQLKIYNSAKNVTRAELPLDPVRKRCDFVLKINGTPDTITMFYDSYPHLVSIECGYTYYFTIDSVIYSRNLVDTVMIRNPFVTTANEENIRIYY